MAYAVVTTTIEGIEQGAVDEDGNPIQLGVAQLDAPDGMFVVSVLGNLTPPDPDYAWSFLGSPLVLHSTSVPGAHQVVRDGDGRVTGVVFFGHYGPDVEVGIVCVD